MEDFLDPKTEEPKGSRPTSRISRGDIFQDMAAKAASNLAFLYMWVRIPIQRRRRTRAPAPAPIPIVKELSEGIKNMVRNCLNVSNRLSRFFCLLSFYFRKPTTKFSFKATFWDGWRSTFLTIRPKYLIFFQQLRIFIIRPYLAVPTYCLKYFQIYTSVIITKRKKVFCYTHHPLVWLVKVPEDKAVDSISKFI